MAHNDGFLDAVCLNEAEAERFEERWYEAGFEDAFSGAQHRTIADPDDRVDVYGFYSRGYDAGWIARWGKDVR